MWLTIAVHDIDRMVWLMESHVKSICASIDTRFHDQPADDHGVALLRFENGNTGLAVVVGYETGAASFDTKIVCTQGIMRIDKMGGLSIARNETWQHFPDESEINPDNWMDDAMVGEWKSFLEAIEFGLEPEVSGEFAKQIMQVIFSAERSAREQEKSLFRKVDFNQN
jgi:phthalate 4,5-cis-dihydrodiol dehydrogenase